MFHCLLKSVLLKKKLHVQAISSPNILPLPSEQFIALTFSISVNGTICFRSNLYYSLKTGCVTFIMSPPLTNILLLSVSCSVYTLDNFIKSHIFK